jgi:hypothetical protein
MRKFAPRKVETSRFFEDDARDCAAKDLGSWKRIERGLKRYAATGWGDVSKVSGTRNEIYRLKVAPHLPRIFFLRLDNREILLGIESRKVTYARHVLERFDRRAREILSMELKKQ